MLRRRRIFGGGPIIRSYDDWVITAKVKDKNGNEITAIPSSGGQYVVLVSASRNVYWSYGDPTVETVTPEITNISLGTLNGTELNVDWNISTAKRAITIDIEIKKEDEDDFNSNNIPLITQNENKKTEIEYGTPKITCSYGSVGPATAEISPTTSVSVSQTQHWDVSPEYTTSMSDLVLSDLTGIVTYEFTQNYDYATIDSNTGVITWQANEDVERSVNVTVTAAFNGKESDLTVTATQYADEIESIEYSDITKNTFLYNKKNAIGGIVTPDLSLSQTKTTIFKSGKTVTEAFDASSMTKEFIINGCRRCVLKNHDKTTEWNGDVDLLIGQATDNVPVINKNNGTITWSVNTEYDVVHSAQVTLNVSANGKSASYTLNNVIQTNNYVISTEITDSTITLNDYPDKNASAGTLSPNPNNSVSVTYTRTELIGNTITTTDVTNSIVYTFDEVYDYATIDSDNGVITWTANEDDVNYRTVGVNIRYELPTHVGETVINGIIDETVNAKQLADTKTSTLWSEPVITTAEYDTVTARGGSVLPRISYNQQGTEYWTSGKQVPLSISHEGSDDEFTVWDITSFSTDDLDDVVLDNITGKLTWNAWPYYENNGNAERTGTVVCNITRNDKTASKTVTVKQTCDEEESIEYGTPDITAFSYDVKDANEGQVSPNISYTQSVTRNWISGATETLDPITYTGPDDENTTYRFKAAAAGVTLDANTGILTWEDNTSLTQERNVTVIATVESYDVVSEKETIAVQAKDELNGTTITYAKPTITSIIKDLAPAEGCTYDGSYLIVDYEQEKTIVNHYTSGDVTTKETITGTLTRDNEKIHTNKPIIPAGTKVWPETQVEVMTVWITVNGIDSDKSTDESVTQEEIFVEQTEYEYGEYTGVLELDNTGMLSAGSDERMVTSFGAVHRSKTKYETLNSGVALAPVESIEYFNGDITLEISNIDTPEAGMFCSLINTTTQSSADMIFDNLSYEYSNAVKLRKTTYDTYEMPESTCELSLKMRNPSNENQWLTVEKISLIIDCNESSVQYLTPQVQVYITGETNVTAKRHEKTFALTTFEASQNVMEVWTSGASVPMDSINAIYGDSVITSTSFGSDVDWITVNNPNIVIEANTAKVDRTGHILVDIVMNGVAGRGTVTITQAADVIISESVTWNIYMNFTDMPTDKVIPAAGGSYALNKDSSSIMRKMVVIWESGKTNRYFDPLSWDEVIGTAMNIGNVTEHTGHGHLVSYDTVEDILTFAENTEAVDTALDVHFNFIATRAPYNTVHTEELAFTIAANNLVSNSYAILGDDALIKNNTTGEYLYIDSSQQTIVPDFSSGFEIDLGTLIVPAKGDSYSITQVFEIKVTRTYASGTEYVEYFYVDQDGSFVDHPDYDNSGYKDNIDAANSAEWLPSSKYNLSIGASGSSLISTDSDNFTFTTQNNKSLDRTSGVISIYLDDIGTAPPIARRFTLVLDADTLRESIGVPDVTYFTYGSNQVEGGGWTASLEPGYNTHPVLMQYIQTVMRYWNCDDSFYDAYNITTGASITYSLRSNGDGLDFVSINSSTGELTLENNESDESRTFAVVAVITMNGKTSDDEICLCTQEAGIKIYKKWTGGNITFGKSTLSAGSDSTTVTIEPWSRIYNWNGDGDDFTEYYTGNVTVAENGDYTRLSETSYTATSTAKAITLTKDTCGTTATEETSILITVTGATTVSAEIIQNANESHAYYGILGVPKLTYPTVGPGMTSTPTSDIELSVYFTSGAMDADTVTGLTLGNDFVLYSPLATGATGYMSFGPDGSVIWNNNASDMSVNVSAELVTESPYYDANGNPLRYLFSTTAACSDIIQPEDNLELPLHIISYGADLTLTCDPGMDGMGSIYVSRNGTSWVLHNFAEEDLVIPADTVVYLGSFTKGGHNNSMLEDVSKLVISEASSADYTVELYGNIMSLVDKDNFSDLTECTESHQFAYLFKGWDKLTKAPMLPADVLGPYCYSQMFQGCVSLVDAPDLMATELVDYCYSYMFYECTSLETAPYIAADEMFQYSCTYMFYGCTALKSSPELPAMTLANSCYSSMFYGCTALETAPELPATTLAGNCYDNMFYGCTALKSSPDLPTMTLAPGCYAQMFYGCTALETAPELPATTLANNCYNGMFYGCTALKSSPDLPATTLGTWSYYNMFRNCSSLVNAPNISATTLATQCCVSMFRGCRSMVSPPELPATTLAQYCYDGMFNGCVALETAPVLSAKVLANYCYRNMFKSCERLSYIEMSATDISATKCMTDWVKGVADSGVFVKYEDTNIPIGESGIPEGWVVEEIAAPVTVSTPLTFKALANNSSVSMTTGVTHRPSLEYSLNGGEWTVWDYGAISLSKGDKVSLRGDNTYINTSDYTETSNFVGAGQLDVYGNVMSLLSKEDYQSMATISSGYCFYSLFGSNTGIVYAHKLLLPATTLAVHCYEGMFGGCASLKTAPELPATTLTDSCYADMFSQCTSLIKAPSILPAATSVVRCYQYMFNSCTSLKTAPKISATTLSGSYTCSNMFYYCSKLNFINAMTTTRPSTSLTPSWTSGVASSGTFLKNPEATWRNALIPTNGIPSGWDTKTSYGSSVSIANPIRMWIDDFSNDSMTIEDYAMDHGYSSVDDYVEGIIAANDKLGGNAYDYTGETMEWNGKTYYVWNYIDLDSGANTGMFKILTNTIDFNELFMNSMEYDCRNEYCPIVAWLQNDDKLYMTDAANQWLIQVQYV